MCVHHNVHASSVRASECEGVCLQNVCICVHTTELACMNLCVYARVFIFVHVHVCAHLCVSTSVCMHVNVPGCVRKYLRAHTFACMRLRTRTFACMHAKVRACECGCKLCVHVCAPLNAGAQMCLRGFSWASWRECTCMCVCA